MRNKIKRVFLSPHELNLIIKLLYKELILTTTNESLEDPILLESLKSDMMYHQDEQKI